VPHSLFKQEKKENKVILSEAYKLQTAKYIQIPARSAIVVISGPAIIAGSILINLPMNGSIEPKTFAKTMMMSKESAAEKLTMMLW
jgi:hypothetical protein